MDYLAEESETDRISDAQRPMTEKERDRIIKQISKEIEALDDAQRVQPAQPGATSKAA